MVYLQSTQHLSLSLINSSRICANDLLISFPTLLSSTISAKVFKFRSASVKNLSFPNLSFCNSASNIACIFSSLLSVELRKEAKLLSISADSPLCCPLCIGGNILTFKLSKSSSLLFFGKPEKVC